GYAYVLQDGGVIAKIGNGVSEVAPTGNFTQVVAGKILSGKPILEIFGDPAELSAQSAEPNTDKWEQKNGSSDYTLKSEYIDGTDYISAALDANGKVTVWGNIGGTAIPSNTTLDLTSYGIGGTNAKHKVAALFGGYADNLFMLTNLGKIVRVRATNASTFNVTLYDAFTYVGADNQVKDIQNWDVVANATSATPTVEFNAGVYDTKATQAQASATVDLNSVTAVGTGNTDASKLENARSYVKINGNSLTSVTNAANLKIANEIVRLNNSGDAYRMILPTNGQGSSADSNYTKTENFVIKGTSDSENNLENIIGIGTTPANVGKLSFYWNSSETNGNPTTEMPADVAFRYFKIEYNYNDTDKNVSFTVTPKRPTQGRAIVMRFWVGRYDYTEKFGVGGTDKRFYDFKPVEISIKIGNTPIEPIFTTAGTDSKSALPLLDANNPYNKYYSIAVMDVSFGLDEIRKILAASGVVNKSDDPSKPVIAFSDSNAITNLITDDVDCGFPAKSKIEKGDLVYYGLATDNNTSNYYNDKYPYLAKDRDGDVLRFIDINGVGALQGSNTYFDYNVATVQVTIPFVMPAADADKIRNTFSGTTANSNVPWFDNQYGLTIALTEDTSATTNTNNATLTVSYQVLRITAKASMGNGWVSYTKGDISDPELRLLDTNVNDRNGMLSGTVLRPEIGSNENTSEVLNNTDNDEAGVEAGTNVHRALEVFTQSSLRLSGNKLGGNAGSVYGKVDTNGTSETVQEYTYQSISFSMRDATHDIDFADFFDNIDNITVAYSNHRDNKPIVG
ncbi:MAG: hypothetical protein K2L51_03550, partial [Clostridiales bacterium]|nr:hypothetical protein [Clostridiales bacterium]